MAEQRYEREAVAWHERAVTAETRLAAVRELLDRWPMEEQCDHREQLLMVLVATKPNATTGRPLAAMPL